MVSFCLGAILLLAFLGFKNGLKWSAGLLLLEYLLLLFFLTVLSRDIQAEKVIDLSPFWSYRAFLAGRRDLLSPIIGNVISFFPVGLLLGCVFMRKKWWKVMLIGGSFSVLIETLQYVLRRGFTEFDDVFHNVLGCMVGYGLCKGIAYLVMRSRRNKQRITKQP